MLNVLMSLEGTDVLSIISKVVLPLLQWRRKHRDSSRSFSKQGSGVRVRQTGRSCRAQRADPCIMLAVFLPPAVGPGDLEELSHGGFHETAEVSFLFPLHFCSLLSLVTHTSRKPVSVNFWRVSSITRALKPSSTSCQEVWSLHLLDRLGAAASDVLQCLQPLLPAAVWEGLRLSSWDSALGWRLAS